ncbi:hypothetical protein NHX12_018694 [Muraenolepis orangiensis]|uniref:Uncharacterized protein n=1 Tax=Muraenolepis orangiensis TaxID=630683 RepID=A0A9Q0EX28_9TELE|nr:hypothetical protein NHX12_018694 [Muraenolepis orangiensis]
MFEGFMNCQRKRDEWIERVSAKQMHQFRVLSHQVQQLQLEHVRGRTATSTPVPPADRSQEPQAGHRNEPKMSRLEEGDNIEHYLTVFERLAGIY